MGKPTLEITAAVDSAWEERPKSDKPLRKRRVTGPAQRIKNDITYQDVWAEETVSQRMQDDRPTQPSNEKLTNEIHDYRTTTRTKMSVAENEQCKK